MMIIQGKQTPQFSSHASSVKKNDQVRLTYFIRIGACKRLESASIKDSGSKITPTFASGIESTVTYRVQ